LVRRGGGCPEDEGEFLGGAGVGKHEAHADGDFADGVAVHPGDAAFELF
jgi:hypothetical protein